jgi:hypothetical protein
VTNAALATALTGEARYQEAFDAWSKIDAGGKTAKFKKIGDALIGQMVSAKRFRYAALVEASLLSNETDKPVVGKLVNGGFENGVKLRNAALFEWQIADGAEPQIGLNETQKHSGNYSLWMLFNSFETAGFRAVSQTVAVDPGAKYRFRVFYRSDVRSSATLKWEIANAGTNAPIASAPPLVPASDWTSVEATFEAPPDVDGVIVRFVREGCSGPSCPTNGKIAFDDIELIRIGE